MTPTERTIQWICRAIIAFVVALPVYLGVRHGLANLEVNTNLESALAGAFLIHMHARPKPAEWMSALGIGSFLTVIYAWLHHGYGASWGAAPFAYAAFLGLASLLVLAAQLGFGDRALRRLHRETLFAAAALPYFSFILAFFLNWTATLEHSTYDLSLYGFDEALQCRLNVLIGNWMASSPALTKASVLVYRCLPLAICFLVALERQIAGKFQARILPLFIAVELAGASMHNVFPALGPLATFGKDFPANLPPVSSIVIQPLMQSAAERTAMPSVEFACALLVCWNVVGLSRIWRCLATILLALTFLASLGFGQHYLVDLVVAVPFAVALQSFALRVRSWVSSERRIAFWGSVSLLLCWIVGLRTGLLINSTVLAWCAVVGTLAASFWWKRGLDREHRCLEKQVLAVRPDILPQEP